ncbi:hypothetical protein CYY_010149 [Polysphondylium violaceum]|uniref:Uncharacterized protein n=1 Tax=Polysphondylium violaceum TaxID=133409 RepID=A0A8J4PLU0_9MYCE|nr:hypothetical protein CYY_010149 [Polysphondylium violaceum]
MSTRVFQSSVIDQSIETVWATMRSFTFPEKVFPTIESATMEDGAQPTCVGAVRTLKWKTGETRSQRLLELSDLSHTIVYELIDSSPPTEVTAYITSIKLCRITDSNKTLITWEGEFSSDVKSDVIQFEQKSFQLNLQDLKRFFTK